MNNGYLKINFDMLKDMERLKGLETYCDSIVIEGFTKDNIEIKYSTSVNKALEIGLIEKRGL